MLLATRIAEQVADEEDEEDVDDHVERSSPFPGTFHRFSRQSCLTVMSSFEMPYSARLPSAVAVFIEMTKLAQMTTTKKLVRFGADELVEGADVVEQLHGLRCRRRRSSAERHQRVDEEDEERRRHQCLPRVTRRVLVLRRERRGRLGRRRPDHDPDPDECHLQAAPGEAASFSLYVRLAVVEVAVDERQEREAEERDHEQDARRGS